MSRDRGVTFSDRQIIDALNRNNELLEAVARLLVLVNRKENQEMSALDDISVQLDDLKASVDASAAGEASAIALLNGLAAKVDELLASGGDPAAVLAKIADLNTQVKAGTDSLAAAVAADAR